VRLDGAEISAGMVVKNRSHNRSARGKGIGESCSFNEHRRIPVEISKTEAVGSGRTKGECGGRESKPTHQLARVTDGMSVCLSVRQYVRRSVIHHTLQPFSALLVSHKSIGALEPYGPLDQLNHSSYFNPQPWEQ
jgi:hypothetical protein